MSDGDGSYQLLNEALERLRAEDSSSGVQAPSDVANEIHPTGPLEKSDRRRAGCLRAAETAEVADRHLPEIGREKLVRLVELGRHGHRDRGTERSADPRAEGREDAGIFERERQRVARKVGERMWTEAGADRATQIVIAFRLLTGEMPSDAERAVLETIYQEQYDEYAGRPDAARQLLAIGESSRETSIDPASLAAATMVASAIMNYDAAVMRR